MERMPASYAKASKVLVLDDELMHTPADLDIEELHIRIACTDWMSRLWTLQEGVLTPQNGLYFQMLGQSISYDDKISQRLIHNHPFNDLVLKSLCWTSLHQIHNIVGLADFSIPLSRRFDVLMSLLRGRGTSIPGDVPFVFCNLTGLDPAPILRLPYEHDIRQQYLATMQDRWPQSILFHPGPRLHEQGYRWFLQSFVASDSSRGALGSLRQEPSFLDRTDEQLGTRLAEGLLVSYTGYMFTETEVTKNSSVDIYFPEADVFANCGALYVDIAFGKSKYRDIALGPGRKMGLIQQDAPLVPGKNNQALIVSIVCEDSTILYCRYEWRVNLVLLTGEDNAAAASVWKNLTVDEIAKDFKRAVAHRSPKKWCVG